MRAVSLLEVGLCCSLVGCSWQRFDDVSDNAPVVLLEPPGSFESGFGLSVATVSLRGGDPERAQLFVGGPPHIARGAVHELGMNDQPGLDAVDIHHCGSDGDEICSLIEKPAGLPIAVPSNQELELCFVSGVGSVSSEPGLVARCNDETQFVLPVPDDAVPYTVELALTGDTPDPMYLATDTARVPALMAGTPVEGLAWYYAPGVGAAPVQLVPPGDVPESFGASVAVARLGDARLYAVGAPESGEVWLFRSDGDVPAEPIGCIDGPARFGLSLAAGRVDDDDVEDLVVASAEGVDVFSGSAFATLPSTTESTCSLASLAGGLLASLSCGSDEDATGCDQANFGVSLAVGDLDGDDDGEVVVGAPGMTVRGEERAGAVLVYDVESDDASGPSDILFLSSADQDDGLGRSLAIARQAERDVIAAGVPGAERAALFYCSSLVPDTAGPRCQ